MTRNLSLCVLMLLLAATVAQALTWTATSPLPVGRRNVGLVHYNEYVYCVGGRTEAERISPNPHADSAVYYAKVNADGSIGAWTATTSLPEPLASVGIAAYDGYVYVYGGWEPDYITSNNCYYAQIQPGGSLGSWITSSRTIPNSGLGDSQMDSMGVGIMSFGDTLYIVNGEDNFPLIHSEVYYNEINASHDYTTWTLTVSTPQACWFHGVATYHGLTQDYIYRLCGSYWATQEVDSYYNAISADGSLTSGTWTQTTGSLPFGEGRYDAACAIGNGRIFVIGGLEEVTPQNTVYYGNINPATGDIAAWVLDGSPYPISVARFSAVRYPAGGHEYILGVGGGGYYRYETIYTDCYYAQIDAPSEVTDWALYR